jgi:porphobilinogen synthase
MMDGRVGALRSALDASKFIHTRIMAYSAKYASAFTAHFETPSAWPLIWEEQQIYLPDGPANGNEALWEVGSTRGMPTW